MPAAGWSDPAPRVKGPNPALIAAVAVIGGLSLCAIYLIGSSGVVSTDDHGYSSVDVWAQDRLFDIVWSTAVVLTVGLGGWAAGAGRSVRAGWAAGALASIPFMVMWWAPKLLYGLFGSAANLVPIRLGEPSGSGEPILEYRTSTGWLVFVGTVLVVGLLLGGIALAMSRRLAAFGYGLGIAVLSGGLTIGAAAATAPSSPSDEFDPVPFLADSAQAAAAAAGSNGGSYGGQAWAVLAVGVLIAGLIGALLATLGGSSLVPHEPVGVGGASHPPGVAAGSTARGAAPAGPTITPIGTPVTPQPAAPAPVLKGSLGRKPPR